MKTAQKKVLITYVGMPETSDFSDTPPAAPKGMVISTQISFDEYVITITAPQEAANRMHRWLEYVITSTADYRDHLISMFTWKGAKKPGQYPLIGEELWTITLQ